MKTYPHTVWGWATSRDEERWSEAFETLAEAIADALAEAHPEDPIWVRSGYQPDPADAFDVDLMLEIAADYASDNWGEVFDVFPDLPAGAADMLQKMVDTWARNYVNCDAWIADGEPECVRP